MVPRRLNKNQKDEILEGYRAGETTFDLSSRFQCSVSTIDRTVKTLISETEYKTLKQKRKEINKKKITSQSDEVKNKSSEDEEEENFVINEVNKSLQTSTDAEDSDLNQAQQDFENVFEEIVPLISSFGFEKEEQKADVQILKMDSLPECVYMLVDKKVELEAKFISDLPEWSFLPENELKRNAIILYSNQRSAKRNCSRNQRVIKIPNSNVFDMTKSYLLSKGITRLILEDTLISLDEDFD